MWGPRHGQCCGYIFLGPICQWIPWEEIRLSLNCPTQTVTRSMLQISFSCVILIIIAFYHGRVIFKIVFIFPLLKSGNIKVVGGEIFCSGSMLCFNNPLKFIFWEDRSLCVHQTTILFCPFPISVAVKIKLWLCNMLILDSKVLHCLRFHRKDTSGEEVVWDLFLKSRFAFSSKGLVQALSELQSRAAHSSLCLLAQAAVHMHTHNLCLHTEQGQGLLCGPEASWNNPSPSYSTYSLARWPNTDVSLGVVPGSY